MIRKLCMSSQISVSVLEKKFYNILAPRGIILYNAEMFENNTIFNVLTGGQFGGKKFVE